MIRINLLRGMAAPPTTPMIGRRVLWLGVALLAAGSGALLYLGSASNPPLPAAPSPAPPAAPAEPTPAAPPAEPQPPPSTFQVEAVSIRAEADAMLILIQVDPRVMHSESELTAPDRLVIDMENCQVAIPAGQYVQAVEHPQIRRVRASQFQTDPAVARIVVDFKSVPRYQLRPTEQGLEIRVAN